MMLEFVRLYGESDGYPSSYPKYYAGSYINGDDKLLIKFVDRSIMNTSDKVQAINVQKSWWSNGEGSAAAYTIKGLVKTSVISGAYPQLGDSGGTIVLSEGNNNYAAVGTFTGFNLSGDLYYSPMSHVPSGFTVEIGYDGDLP